MRQAPHLIAGFSAASILIIVLIGFSLHVQSLELRYANALASLNPEQTLRGLAIQRAGFQQSDLLPMFGSSEITLLQNEYEAGIFFNEYPTGFNVMDVANIGASSITLAENLAALGPELKGKKIVISITPANFVMSKLPAEYYAGNFSRLHVYETLFSPYLNTNLKAVIAKRMADFPDTYKDDPFLNFAVFQLAGESRINRALYYLCWPLGELETQVMRIQDHAIVYAYIRDGRISPNVSRSPQSIDWPGTLAKALAEQKIHTASNPLGVEDDQWWKYSYLLTNPAPPGSEDKMFIQRVKIHPEWSDLDILLQALKELGAQPLILSRPMNVRLWEAQGVSEQAQNIYYEKLREAVAPYRFPLVDYQQYGTDIYFSIDQGSHTSREGWIYVNQTLDDFFHGRIQ